MAHVSFCVDFSRIQKEKKIFPAPKLFCLLTTNFRFSINQILIFTTEKESHLMYSGNITVENLLCYEGQGQKFKTK